jgi:periplasmic divalent cation tolerance protein
MTTNIVVILTTVPDDPRTDELARALVDERLAACVNVHAPMRSTYRWKNGVECDPERQLFIKTTRDRVAAVEARLRELHPYELPEFLVLRVESGSDAYVRWVVESTSG